MKNYSTYVPDETAEKLDEVVKRRRLLGRSSAAMIVLERLAGNLATTAVRGFRKTEPYLEDLWANRIALVLEESAHEEIAIGAKKAGIERQRFLGTILVAHQDKFDELIAGNGD